jgi:hypothetical protein
MLVTIKCVTWKLKEYKTKSVFSFILYWSASWSLAQRQERRLTVFKKIMLYQKKKTE